jgi:hypothetical protein
MILSFLQMRLWEPRTFARKQNPDGLTTPPITRRAPIPNWYEN